MASQHEEVPLELITHTPTQAEPAVVVEGAPISGGEVPSEMMGSVEVSAPPAGTDYSAIGAVGGAGIGKTVAQGTAIKDVSVAAMKHALASNNPQVREAAKKVTNLLPGTERWKNSAKEISEASKQVVQDTNIRKKAPQFTRQEWKMAGKELSPMAEKLAAISPAAKVIGKYAMRYANPVVGGALAGAQGMNAAEDFSRGDYLGGAINTIGAGAGAAAMYPPLAPVAIPISLGTEAINYARHNPEFMKQFLANTQPVNKANGGLVYLAEGQSVKKSPASIAGTLNSVGTVQGPSLASMWQEHLASLPQKTEDNLRHQQEVMNRVMPIAMKDGRLEFGQSDPEAMNEFVNTMMPIGGMTKLVKDPVTQILRMSQALAPHEGKVLNITQSDRMRSTMGDLGGPGFSKFQLEHPAYGEAQAAWGVGNQPTASRIVNVNKKYPEGQAIWSPMIGSETQHHSNQHVYDMLSDEFNRQASMGNLSPELRARINAKLAGLTNKEGKNLFASNIDVANPEALKEAGQTFEKRAAMANLLAGNTVGGAKGRIIDYPGIMQEMTDPMTVGAPTHSVGTRLFTLNNQVENRPDLHSAFPYILKGEDQGVAFAPVPKELAIQDWINNFKDFKGREPGYMDLTRNTPSQQITEKYLRNLEDAGHKQGGLVGLKKK